MKMNLTTYKFSTVVAKRYRVILVLLLVALSISCIYSYQVLTPQYETQTETESVTLFKYNAWYEHSAVVEQGNPLWPVGWTLRDQTVYFSTISPNLNGGLNFQINAPPSSDISANYLTKLVLSSSSKNTTYWRKEEIISSGTANLNGVNKLHDSFSLNISEIEKVIDAIQYSLDFYGGDTNTEVITTVRCTGDVDGKHIDKQKDFSLPIEISGSIYKVPSERYEETVKRDEMHEVNVPLPPSKGDKIISYSSIFILFFLIVAFTLVKLKYKPLDDSAIQELIKEREYDKFKDLISKGKLPSDINLLRLEIKSLEDLANVAIDKDERVIFDENASLYFIIHDNLLYLYRGGSL